MPELPPLTVPDVREWVGDRNLAKGRPYFRGGTLRHLRRQGMTLRSECQGTAPAPYSVEIRLDEKGIASGACSCPVGYGGRCKHAAALLLAWLHETESFAEVVDADEALAALDHERLAQLVKQVYARFPEARVWLDTELTRLTHVPEVTAAAASGDADTIAADVVRALDEARTAHQDTHVLPLAVEDVLTAARGAATDGDYARAVMLYSGVTDGAVQALANALEEVEEEGDEYDDYEHSGFYYGDAYEEARIDEVMLATSLPMLALDAAVPALADCLPHFADPVQRAPVIELLTDVLLIDVEDYVVEQGAFWDVLDTALIERTTPDERRAVLARFLDLRPDPGGGYERQQYDWHHRDIILALAHGLYDADAYLALCRDLDAREALLDEMLRLGRVDDAVSELRKFPNPLLYEGIFARHGRADRFYDVIRHLPQAESDPTMIAWLRSAAEARGDLDYALDFARRAFDRLPSTANYGALREIATKLDRWEPLRKAIFEGERKAGHWPTIVELYLEDKEVDNALEALQHVKDDHQDPLYSPGFDLRLRVAAAAEATRPDATIALYVSAVDHILTYRGRSYYAKAAELLRRVRELYRGRGQGATWQTLIGRYRDEYRRLTALQDELAKAKLFEREPEDLRKRPSTPGTGLSVAPEQHPPDQTPRIQVVRAPGSPFGG